MKTTPPKENLIPRPGASLTFSAPALSMSTGS